MSVPPSTHHAWMDIVTGRREYEFDFLAAKKMVVGRVKMTIQEDPSAATMKRCADEVREIFAKNENLSKVKADLAKPVADYVSAFTSQMPNGSSDKIVFSCNCILNYLYSELEGEKTGDVTGPMTFGEVAHQLLNQTMVYLSIEDAS